MPSVPYLPQADTRAIPTPRVGANPSGAFGGGEGLQQLGQGIERVGDALQAARQRADATKVTEAETALRSAMNSELSDREFGLLHRQGQDALEYSEIAHKRVREAHQKIAEGLASEEQRNLFRLRSSGMLEDYRRTVESHAAGQIRVVEQTSLKNREDVALEAAAAQYRDAAAVDRELAALEGPIRALAVSPEDAERQIGKHRRQVAGVVLDRYLKAGDVDGARAVLAQRKDDLGVDLSRYDEAITIADRDRRTESEAYRIAEASRNEAGRVDEAEAMAELDKLPKGEDWDRIHQRLTARINESDVVWKKRVDTVYNRAFGTYLETKSLTAIDPKDKAWLIRNATDEWAKIEGRARSDADYWRSRSERKGATPEQTEALIAFQAELVANPDKYLDENYTTETLTREWGEVLSGNGYKSAGASLVALKQRGKTGALVDQREFSLAVDAQMTRNSIATKEDQKLFQKKMGVWLDDVYAAGKRPTQEELQRALDRTAEEVKVERWYGSTTKPRYKVKPDEKILDEAASPVGEKPLNQKAAQTQATERIRSRLTQGLKNKTVAETIPAADRKLITDALQRRGLPATEAAIAAAYRKANGR